MNAKSRLKPYLLRFSFALGLAIFVYWLSSEFRPDGILGSLQVLFEFTVIIPYIVGAIFGRNAHNPNGVAFFFALFIQFYLIVLSINYFVKRYQRMK
jgi:hypothetical protein